MKKLSKKESLFFLMRAIEQYGHFLEYDRNFDTVKSNSEDLKALYDSKNTEEKVIHVVSLMRPTATAKLILS